MNEPRTGAPRTAADALDEDRFDRANRLGWFDLARLRRSRALVVGCGAIGNEVVKNLALTGVGRLDLVDMDVVVPSNLPRCALFTVEDAEKRRAKAEALAAAARRLDAECVALAHAVRVEEAPEALFRDADVVLSCLDNVGARVMLNARALAAGRPLVDAGTRGMVGKVQVVLPGDGPCLECGMNRTHMALASRRLSCTGKDVTFFEPKLAADLPTTALVSAVQAREAVKILHGRYETVLTHLLYVDGNTNAVEVLEVPRNPACPHHPAASGPTASEKAP